MYTPQCVFVQKLNIIIIVLSWYKSRALQTSSLSTSAQCQMHYLGSTSSWESQTNETNKQSFLSLEAWLARSWAFCIFRKIVTINSVSSWYIFTTSGVVYFCRHKKLWTICPFHSTSERISVPRARVWVN